MVSLWPWKGEDNSPASFEKALSALATKISKSQAQLDTLRQRGRRAKALWTLYSSFAYLLCFIILFLVVGWRNWTAVEYTAVSGSPLLIWLIRTGITSYYTFRIDTATQRLETQQAERAKTIDKLKAATKYNSTQELLEKYGGVTPKPKPKKDNPGTSKAPKGGQKIQQGRIGLGPPPTANIHRPGQAEARPPTPQPLPPKTPPIYISSLPATPVGHVAQAEFAPNAFSAPPQYAAPSEVNAEGNWYDRVLDLLLGEDETSPRNRVALICQNCRLVNGQAPPGTKRLADLGKWRCFGCGTMNGEEDEAVKAVKEMKEKIADQPVTSIPELKAPEEEIATDSGDSKDDIETIEKSDEGSEDMVEVQPRRSPRKKA
ncbi:hypothetical protein B0O99DRAFT_598728 [Bisporella sp. PMI_857]|nr:hypothetical protein B0O99DRAFT_598728 [Bisporella sp. PMI_857]